MGAHRGADPAAVGRAAGRAPPAPHLRRAALGPAARLRRGHGARDAVRAADRAPAARSPTGGSTPRCRASCSSAARWWRATGRRGTSSSTRTSGGWRRSRRSRSAPGGATSSCPTRSCTTSTTARIPADVVSGAHFDRWWRDERRRDPERLSFTRELLVDPAAAAALDPRARPRAWRQGDLTLPLSYRFEPGAEHDGVTVHVPLTRARRSCAPDGFEWLVPGAARTELVTALIRSLPKELRRRLVPAPDVAAQRAGAAGAARASRCSTRCRRARARARGARAARGLGHEPPAAAPAHDASGSRTRTARALAEGARPRRAARGGAPAPARRAGGGTPPAWSAPGCAAWTLGTLPRDGGAARPGGAPQAYPALVDEGESVGVRVLDTPAAQAAAMRAGTRRLLLLTVAVAAALGAGPARRGASSSRSRSRRTAASGPSSRTPWSRRSTRSPAQAGGPAWDEAGFARLRDHVAGDLAETTLRVARAGRARSSTPSATSAGGSSR